MQDESGYRYGIINLGGRDRADVLEQFGACRSSLGVSFVPVGSLPQEASSLAAL
jgi:hypothetical protein